MNVPDDVLTKARELDQMEDQDVTTDEANVLERVLKAFADRREPKEKDCRKVKAMYDKYLAPKDADDIDPRGRLGEDDVADAEDEMDVIE